MAQRFSGVLFRIATAGTSFSLEYASSHPKASRMEWPRSRFLRDITIMPSGQLAPKGQGLGAFDPATQTLYFPGSAGDLVDNRVFSVNLRTSGSPTVNTGAPKLDVNGMEWSAAAGGGKGAPLVLGTTTNGSDLSATALYEVVPQAPPIATPWKKLHDYGASVDTMGNT